MAIRNNKLGGSNFVNGEVLYDYDLDDTNNALIDIQKYLLNDSLTTNIKKNSFDNLNYTNSYQVPAFGPNSFKTVQNTTYNVTSNRNYVSSAGFSEGFLKYEVQALISGDGSADILDDFSDSSIGAFWSTSTSLSGSVSESGGTMAVNNPRGENDSATLTSGNILSERLLIIPLKVNARGGGSFPDSAYADIDLLGTGQSGIKILDVISNSSDSPKGFYCILKLYIKPNNKVQWSLIYDSGTVVTGESNITTHTDLKLRFSVSGDVNDFTDSKITIYGVFEELDSLTNDLTLQISNDEGNSFKNVSDSGLVKFDSLGNYLEFKCEGQMAENETAIISLGNFLW